MTTRDTSARGLANYLFVTTVYGAFTATDGALRMLVLLHLYDRGLGPLALATLFVLYEFFGVVTNLVGGWLGARLGLKTTLLVGLLLQAAACAALAYFAEALTVPIVTVAQGVSGVAKDLIKMSSKSYVRFVAPESHSTGLLAWVSWITGSKNTLKGIGYFLGGWLLGVFGFSATCLAMSLGILVVALVAATRLVWVAADRKVAFRSVFSRDFRINYLAAARLCLFASRDVWFAIALPVFLATEFGWSFAAIGAVLAVWVVGYGVTQTLVPIALEGGAETSSARHGARLAIFSAALLLPLVVLGVWLRAGISPAALLALLGIFGLLFAMNSALHSYLIVSFAPERRVAQSVGFYYTANAAGRLIGTFLSGFVYQWTGHGAVGLSACIAVAALFAGSAAWLAWPLRRAEAASFASG